MQVKNIEVYLYSIAHDSVRGANKIYWQGKNKWQALWWEEKWGKQWESINSAENMVQITYTFFPFYYTNIVIQHKTLCIITTFMRIVLPVHFVQFFQFVFKGNWLIYLAFFKTSSFFIIFHHQQKIFLQNTHYPPVYRNAHKNHNDHFKMHDQK